jgi:hypothetical protein
MYGWRNPKFHNQKRDSQSWNGIITLWNQYLAGGYNNVSVWRTTDSYLNPFNYTVLEAPIVQSVNPYTIDVFEYFAAFSAPLQNVSILATTTNELDMDTAIQDAFVNSFIYSILYKPVNFPLYQLEGMLAGALALNSVLGDSADIIPTLFRNETNNTSPILNVTLDASQLDETYVLNISIVSFIVFTCIWVIVLILSLATLVFSRYYF